MKIIGKKLTREEFAEYVKTKNWGSIPPSKIVLHHTWKPTKEEWNGQKSIEALKKYYESLKWQAGPHIFVAEDGIWLFTDMYEVGIHAGTGNAQWEANGKTWNGYGSDFKNNKLIWYSIGIEVVGNYDVDKWSGKTKTNALWVIKTLQDKLNIKDINFHKEYSAKSCPGNAITKEWIKQELENPTDSSFIEKTLDKIASILSFKFGSKLNESEAEELADKVFELETSVNEKDERILELEEKLQNIRKIAS